MDAADAFRESLRTLTETSVQRVAEEAGYSRSSFDLYLNRRPPSEAALRALAEVLRKRADRLREYADRLEDAADERAGGTPSGSGG